jgi:predicted enzyme related to lactoylglutathione lyase
MERKANRIDFVEFPATSVAAVAAAKAFYEEVLGWAFTDWGEDYIDTKSSGVGAGFNADPSHRSKKPLAVVYCADLSAARSKVLAAGGTVTKEIFSFPGGRRFHFEDPSGNELALWSDGER